MSTPIIFAGTPEFAAVALEALHQHPDYHIPLILTRPDRPKGRGRKPQASAVKEYAMKAGIPIYQPDRLDDKAKAHLDKYQAALCVVAAYGLIFPKWILQYYPHGCINIHASLLPRWRGAAPIERAIEAGDNASGISIMQMEEGLDSGPVWLMESIAIHPEENAKALHLRLSKLGAKCIIEALPHILNRDISPREQDETKACYAHKLSKEEGKINWRESLELIERKIRAYNPYPMAYSDYHDNNRLRIIQAYAQYKQEPSAHPPGTILQHDRSGLHIQCQNGVLIAKEIQLAGKKPTSAAALANGLNLTGIRLR